ncbi:MAG: hypothetical protein KIT62_01085 [Cyclobacteriaceae bacterium]|nr:hypothetical protein [Cyclobacteriaceae bacterium]
MKKISFLCLLLLGCDKEEMADACADTVILNEPPCQTFVDVTPPCIIQEVIKRVEGHELTKYVYYHNGLNYDRIDIYDKDVWQDEYPEEPVEIATLIYEGDQIKEVTVQPSATPNFQRKAYYEYSYMSVTTILELVEGGVVTNTTSYDQLFLINPKDSTYLNKGVFDILREYKNGNNTRFAVEADTGRCIINEQRWVFTVKTSFDLNPNVFHDYAVRFPLGKETGYAGQFWFGNNRNNIVATIYSLNNNNKVVNCYTFLRNGGQTWVKEYESTSASQFHYTYKYSCE